jgi:hypothetical protein
MDLWVDLHSMTRRIWIAVLACALAGYAAVSAYSVAAWIAHRHVTPLGWLLIASDALCLWIAFGYLRFKVRDAREVARLAEASGAPDGLGYLADVSGPGAATATHE